MKKEATKEMKNYRLTFGVFAEHDRVRFDVTITFPAPDEESAKRRARRWCSKYPLCQILDPTLVEGDTVVKLVRKKVFTPRRVVAMVK